MNAPGTCVDCGNEAYIQLAGEGETMICAHCFADRGRVVKAAGSATAAAATAERGRGPEPELRHENERRPSPAGAMREAAPAPRRAAG